MPRNLELKARCESLASASRHAQKLSGRKPASLIQTDTYFDVPEGRLKLREIANQRNELIFYRRPDKQGTRISSYTIVRVHNPKEVISLLKKLFGIVIIVRKKRDLYLYQNARIHLDLVRELGTFIEIEVIVRRGMNQAQRLMNRLITEFGVRQKDFVSASYSNLLLSHRQRRAP